MQTRLKISDLDIDVLNFLQINKTGLITQNQLLFVFNRLYFKKLQNLCYKIAGLYFCNVFSVDELINSAYYEILIILTTKRKSSRVPFENYFWATLKFRILNTFNTTYNSQTKFETKIAHNLMNLANLQSKMNWIQQSEFQNYRNLAFLEIQKLLKYLNNQERKYVQLFISNQGNLYYSASKIKELNWQIKQKINKHL
ncbi:hypothetical protein BCF59_0067 [Mycoplasmopsis mustelae]|uniref:Uncharacterized protein n=1 Tax=Mycoplasmopsis mustelae TaxID=171289 RepID=A0A4R7UDX5_9BACT|nr:hypothetical protein [Mycoplasmopsis mustelae]TDV24121.1 hypothetical protein BCF59_0067 [Mycoplasmopsis mustelae]